MVPTHRECLSRNVYNVLMVFASDAEERDSDAVASPAEDNISVAEPEPDDSLAVMRKELQDPSLENIYKNLPPIE